MPCPHDNLPLLATGRLSGFAKWRTARHVKSCPSCTAELDQLSSLSGQLRAHTLSEPSPNLDERVLAIGYKPVLRRQRSPLFSLRSFVLALPLLITVIFVCIASPYILSLTQTKTVTGVLQVQWDEPDSFLPSQYQWKQWKDRRNALQRIIKSSRSPEMNHVSVGWQWRDSLKNKITRISVSRADFSNQNDDEKNMREFMERIVRGSQNSECGCSVRIIELPDYSLTPENKSIRYSLFAFVIFLGTFVGLVAAFFIWMLKIGGSVSVVPFAISGVVLGLIFSTYQSLKVVFHAQGKLYISQSHDPFWERDRVLQLAQSEEMQRNLQDAEKYKIHFLNVETDKEGSLRFSANGRYSNYTAGTVNLWMRRVQDRLLKEWKEKERPSRVEEMNPPVRIAEAVEPAKPIPPDFKGNVAAGLFLGLFFGGIYGYFYRPTRDRGRGASFPEA